MVIGIFLIFLATGSCLGESCSDALEGLVEMDCISGIEPIDLLADTEGGHEAASDQAVSLINQQDAELNFYNDLGASLVSKENKPSSYTIFGKVYARLQHRKYRSVTTWQTILCGALDMDGYNIMLENQGGDVFFDTVTLTMRDTAMGIEGGLGGVIVDKYTMSLLCECTFSTSKAILSSAGNIYDDLDLLLARVSMTMDMERYIRVYYTDLILGLKSDFDIFPSLRAVVMTGVNLSVTALVKQNHVSDVFLALYRDDVVLLLRGEIEWTFEENDYISGWIIVERGLRLDYARTAEGLSLGDPMGVQKYGVGTKIYWELSDRMDLFVMSGIKLARVQRSKNSDERVLELCHEYNVGIAASF